MNLKIKAYLILCICFSVALCANPVTEGIKVLTLEQQITAAAKMDFSNYKLYPFAITKKQQFSLSFIQQQNVKGQIRVNWIDVNKNQLSYPAYDETQYIRITIMDSKLNKTIQQRKFHFQTGINFHAQPNHRYKLIFTDFGNMNKMIQLTISKVEPLKIFQLASLNTKNSTQKTVILSKQIHSELNILTVQARRSDFSMKNVYNYIIDNLSQYLIFSAWEVCLVAVMMVIQILMFRNLVKNNWSFV